MDTDSFKKMDGEVESDETYIGGKAANMHAARRARVITGRGSAGKTIVHGLLERGIGGEPSQVRASVVPDTEAATLVPELAHNVEPSATIYTDSHASYMGLFTRWVHQWVNHATAYVVGKVHTNGLENFWSLLKRGLRGTYIHVAHFHLFRYLDEQVFRFNKRKLTDSERFQTVMQSVIGKRLTFRQLCMIDGCGFMGIE